MRQPRSVGRTGKASEDFHMDLKRAGQHPHVQSTGVFTVSPIGVADASFPAFGDGFERNSHFHVAVHWKDVEALVQAFSAAGHPEATKLVKAASLASAIRAILEISN
jgi:hypothetical protein